MCTPTAAGTMIPYGLKIPSPYFSFGPTSGGGGGGGGGVTQGQLAALDFQRSQLHDYNVRVQLGLRNYQNSLGLSPFHTYITDPYAHAYFYKHDPRARFVQEEPKPSHSYIGLIGMAILHSKEKKLVLSDIYQWILDNYPYFRTRGPGWRNSIRHNLSLNDCFIKSGRSANGKGHYWAVHPANVDDFERGDFRRRRAQRKVRRHMGLAVPDDDDSPSPSPTQPWMHHDVLGSGSGDKSSSPSGKDHGDLIDVNSIRDMANHSQEAMRLLLPQHHPNHPTPVFGLAGLGVKRPSRKRLFDMASLLAPDEDDGDKLGDHSEIRSLSSPQSIPSSSTGACYGDTHIIHKGDESEDVDMENCSQNKNSDNSSVISRRGDREQSAYDDDDNFCDEDDDENCEEIHVTSDDETPTRVSRQESNKCFSDAESDTGAQEACGSHGKTMEENRASIQKQTEDEEKKGKGFDEESNDLQQSQAQHHNILPPPSVLDGKDTQVSDFQTTSSTVNNTALLKQSQNIVQNATTMKAIYEFMSDKLRDRENNILNPLDRIPNPAHLAISHQITDTTVPTSDEHKPTPRHSISLHDNNSPKDDTLFGPTSISDPRLSLRHAPNPLPESISNSLRNEHQLRALHQNIGKDFTREGGIITTSSFSPFEALGIRPNSSLFSTGTIHPGMLRAMAPFAGNPTSLLSQSPIARPGIPTSCLQMLQASPAVSVPSLPMTSPHNTLSPLAAAAGVIDTNNKR